MFRHGPPCGGACTTGYSSGGQWAVGCPERGCRNGHPGQRHRLGHGQEGQWQPSLAAVPRRGDAEPRRGLLEHLRQHSGPEEHGTQASPFRFPHQPRSRRRTAARWARSLLRFPYRGQPKAVPLDIEIRYTLRRGDSGLYGWTIADHDPHYPAFNIEVSTVCLKLNPDVFDFLSVDSRRQRHMASAEDWVKGTQLNLWEARRLNTGIRKGEVEHKYDYNVLFSQTPAWGWSSTKRNVGLFIVNPSIEYLNGSPVMVDYVGHIDVKPSLPADPTLLFIWHSPHYGGRPIQIKANERWRKIVGPFLFYCNAGESPEAMWKDSLARAAEEQKAWPYAWAEAPGYEHAAAARKRQRPARDPRSASIRAPPRRGAWVGLAQAPYAAAFAKRGPITIDWQTDGKHYQYWTRADADGAIHHPAMRGPAPTRSTRSPTACWAISAGPTFTWKRARRPNLAS